MKTPYSFLAIVLLALLSPNLANGAVDPQINDRQSHDVPLEVLSGGAAAILGSDHSGGRWSWDAAITRYTERSGLGVAFGGSLHHAYLEFQPVLVLSSETTRESHSLFLGVNPGVVSDWSDDQTKLGAQLTIWASFSYGCCHGPAFPMPIVPFLRIQALRGSNPTVVGGVMLKLAIPLFK